ncbi:MAG: ABC transporter permease subunit [Acidobacteria bacterium]|nr:ABC transporter permease subunit [Acidobacteriota bacterium]
MSEFFQTFLNLEVMAESAGLLARGLLVTIEACLIVIPGGLFFGAGLALAQTLAPRAVTGFLSWGVDLVRAFPPLVLLVLVVHGLPFLGIEPPPLLGVGIALTINTSTYYGEILRAGILSIEPTQWEAARSTGLGTAATLRHVILPQGVRNVLPDLAGNTLEAVKLTSLASVVALPDLLRMARVAQGVHFNPSPLILAALLYLALLWPLVRLVRRLGGRAVLPA